MTLSITKHADHVRVTGEGFFSMPDAVEHFADLAAIIADHRRRAAPIRVIVDLRDGSPQSPEVSAYIKTRTTMLYRPHDRVAIMVRSSILKLQLRRIHAEQKFGVFLSEAAAAEFIAREEVAAA